MWREVSFALLLAATGTGLAMGVMPAKERMALRSMHADFVEAFVGSKGFGPARITPMLAKMHAYRANGIGNSDRCVLEVELVGIARHNPPLVYPSGPFGLDHSASKDSPLRRLNARGLLDWERQALAQLAAGQSLYFQSPAGMGNVMGPLSAQPQCLECHATAREGELLGALSYRLGRLQAPVSAPGKPVCLPEV